MHTQKIKEMILTLKEEMGALILAHNYQIGDIQDVADFVGDSLELARIGAETDSDLIVFCGVYFMAETVKMLSPEKTVLVPRKDAGCPMANMITSKQLKDWKAKHPGAMAVTYVNSTADVKTETDICCTSSNAVQVIQNLDTDTILFSPDRNLGGFCRQFTDKNIILWDGFCHVHDRFRVSDIEKAREHYPDAEIIVHPECPVEVSRAADHAFSTSGILKYCSQSSKKSFIIGTEEGLIYRLKKENPEKTFYSLGSAKICINMKKTGLEDLLRCLENRKSAVELDEKTIQKGRIPIERMLGL